MIIDTQVQPQIKTTEMPSPASFIFATPMESLLPVALSARDEANEPTILVVDDDKDIREVLTDLLEDGGYIVASFVSGAHLLQDFHPGDADCLLVDAQLPEMSGIDLIRRIKSIDSALPSILVTGTSP